jgi:ABC-2 type transport system permease protein
VLVYLAGALALYALGVVLAALAPNARTANAVGFVVYFPMIVLSGAVISVAALAALTAMVVVASAVGVRVFRRE